MKVGDFVKVTYTLQGGEHFEDVDGRIVATHKNDCLVATESGLIVKVLKENIKVTLTIEEHRQAIQKWLEENPPSECVRCDKRR